MLTYDYRWRGREKKDCHSTSLPPYSHRQLFGQKQWQVTGATEINHPLASKANKRKHLPAHIQTCGSALARCIRFLALCTNEKIVLFFSQVEVTADPVWGCWSHVPMSDTNTFYLFTICLKALLASSYVARASSVTFGSLWKEIQRKW